MSHNHLSPVNGFINGAEWKYAFIILGENCQVGRRHLQSDALTLRIFVIRLVGSDLRARRFCRTWPNRQPNRRFYG